MQCPVCKAMNDRGPQCRRCKADLALLFDLDEQRGRLLAAARWALGQGDTLRALELAERADGLRRDKESRRLRSVCHVLQRNFAEAWGGYQSLAATR